MRLKLDRQVARFIFGPNPPQQQKSARPIIEKVFELELELRKQIPSLSN